MAVQSLSLLTEQAGQTEVCDLQVTRGADEEVRRLQVLHTQNVSVSEMVSVILGRSCPADVCLFILVQISDGLQKKGWEHYD